MTSPEEDTDSLRVNMGTRTSGKYNNEGQGDSYTHIYI